MKTVLKCVSIDGRYGIHHVWRCEFSGCKFNDVSLITALFHLQDDHRISVDQLTIQGDTVLWKDDPARK